MSKNKGFTMIELLVVISVLGILAAGILAAIDPFEQLKKARDTSNRDSVLALHQAFIRYYGTHGSLPWDNAAITATSSCGSASTAAGAQNRLFGPGRITPRALTFARMGSATAPGTTCTGLLESEGELKTGFVAAVGGSASEIYVLSTVAADLYVCFAPSSKSMYAEDSVKYTVVTSGAGLGISESSATTCSAANKATGAVSDVSTAKCFYCAK